MQEIVDIEKFLVTKTPERWCQQALANLSVLLIDHAHCEKKAASTALSLMYRYVQYPQLLQKMSRLAREELRHFEKVLAILTARGIDYQHLTAGRYAQALRQEVRPHDPERLIDTLIVGALIEARSCERFARLMPYLDEELATFYRSLLRSEARHFHDYLSLAQTLSSEPIEARIAEFSAIEQKLIVEEDDCFRFHSGPLKEL